MLAKKSMVKNDSGSNDISSKSDNLKQPFRVGKYWKSSSKNPKDNSGKQQVNNKGLPNNNNSNQLYVVKEEKYTSSYHSFRSLENINVPETLDEQTVDPKIASIKSKYDSESFIDRSNNKFFDESFVSDKTESLIGDANEYYDHSQIFEEHETNLTSAALAEHAKQQKKLSEG